MNSIFVVAVLGLGVARAAPKPASPALSAELPRLASEPEVAKVASAPSASTVRPGSTPAPKP